jgi:hypothetical protein
MTPVLAQIVDVGKLLQTIEAAAIAGVGISIAFSLVIYGFARAGEHRAQSHPVAATAHVALGLAALVVCGLGVAFGLSTMLSK